MSTEPFSTYSRAALGGGILGIGILALIGVTFHPGAGYLLPVGLILVITGGIIMLSGIADGFRRGR